MIDAGLSGKKLEQLLEQRNMQGEQIDAIFVTHEHADHIKGLGVMCRKYKLPVYANQATWNAMQGKIGEIDPQFMQIIEPGEMQTFGELQMKAFPISHDAVNPVAYWFKEGDSKLSVATDLGYMSSNVKKEIQDSDVIVLESNHDVNMLQFGKYPWNIKRRILGDTGHLSNEAAGQAIADLLEVEQVRRIYLAHLSLDHNMMELAKVTIQHELKEKDLNLEQHNVKLMDTYPYTPTLWDEVGN